MRSSQATAESPSRPFSRSTRSRLTAGSSEAESGTWSRLSETRRASLGETRPRDSGASAAPSGRPRPRPPRRRATPSSSRRDLKQETTSPANRPPWPTARCMRSGIADSPTCDARPRAQCAQSRDQRSLPDKVQQHPSEPFNFRPGQENLDRVHDGPRIFKLAAGSRRRDFNWPRMNADKRGF